MGPYFPWLETDRQVGHFESEKKTVMICDDDRDLLNLFGQALKIKYNIISVSSGENCIDRFIEE